MNKYRKRSEVVRQVDFVKRYSAPDDELEALYGLPRKVQFCKSCVISNQRPNSAIEYQHKSHTKKATIAFDSLGTCDACKVAEEKKSAINWEERERELIDLCNKHRKNGKQYDCLVPGSGGKDSSGLICIDEQFKSVTP